MLYSFAKRLLAALLAVFCFFSNLGSGSQRWTFEAPESAISVTYADKAHCTLKLFMNEGAKSANVLFLIHGGSWMGGTESEYYADCLEAVKLGYCAATIDYSKLNDGATVADMVDEIDLAVKAVKTEMENRGTVPKSMVMAGHSAGAHLMLLYAYSRYKTCPIPIAFTVSNAGPTEFLTDAKAKTTMMGKSAYLLLSAMTKEVVLPSTIERNKAAIDSVSPLSMVTKDVPPTIVVHGDADTIVPFQNGVDLYNALQGCGVDTEMIVYKGGSHFLSSKDDAAKCAEVFFAFAEKYCK